MKIFVWFLVLIVTLFLIWVAMSLIRSKNNKTEFSIPSGTYVGETSNPGYFKLEIKPGMEFQFQNIVSLHNPPQIIEDISGQIKMNSETSGILVPGPKAIQEEISYLSDKSIVVYDKAKEKKIKLILKY